MLAAQSYWFDGPLVALVGLRRDTVRLASVLTSQLGSGANAGFANLKSIPVPHDWLSTATGDTATYGFVVHPTAWLSAHFNSSETYSPVRSACYPEGSFIRGRPGWGSTSASRFPRPTGGCRSD